MEDLAAGRIAAGRAKGLWPSDLALVRIGCKQTIRALLKLHRAKEGGGGTVGVPALAGWDVQAVLHDVHALVARVEGSVTRILADRGLEGVR